jgi:hypothetical protein
MKGAILAAILCGGMVCAAVGQLAVDVDGLLRELQANPMDPIRLNQLRTALAGVDERERQCQLSVLYGLGLLALGHREEGMAVRKAVLERYAGHPLLAELALDQIGDPCGACENGRVFVPCPRCEGSGLCPICKGTGIQKVHGLLEPREVKCMHCPDAPGKCPLCRGAKGYWKACAVCEGTGRQPSPAKAERRYRMLLKALAPPAVADPMVVVVTAVPPVEAAPDSVQAAREEAGRAVQAAREQVARSPWLSRYGIRPEEWGQWKAGGTERDVLIARLRERGLRHGTRGWFFLIPVPAGLRYEVAEIRKDRAGQTVVRLSSTPTPPRRGEPPARVTPREALRQAAAELAPSLGEYLSDPMIWVLDGSAATFRKGEVIESGEWVAALNLSHEGMLSVVPGYYRSAEEAVRHLGLREP